MASNTVAPSPEDSQDQLGASHARDGLIKQLYSLVDHVSELLGAIEED